MVSARTARQACNLPHPHHRGRGCTEPPTLPRRLVKCPFSVSGGVPRPPFYGLATARFGPEVAFTKLKNTFCELGFCPSPTRGTRCRGFSPTSLRRKLVSLRRKLVPLRFGCLQISAVIASRASCRVRIRSSCRRSFWQFLSKTIAGQRILWNCPCRGCTFRSSLRGQGWGVARR